MRWVLQIIWQSKWMHWPGVFTTATWGLVVNGMATGRFGEESWKKHLIVWGFWRFMWATVIIQIEDILKWFKRKEGLTPGSINIHHMISYQLISCLILYNLSYHIFITYNHYHIKSLHSYALIICSIGHGMPQPLFSSCFSWFALRALKSEGCLEDGRQWSH